VLILVVILGLGAYAGSRALHLGGGSGSAKDYAGEGSGSVTVLVDDGDSVTAIGTTLVRDGVVASVGAFQTAAAADSRATSIQPGSYRLHRKMSAANALSLLLDPASRVQSSFTVPEGTSIAHLPDLIARTTKLSAAEVTAALAKPAALKLPSYADGKPEGFLFPATYQVQPGAGATQVLQQMVARFEQTAAATNLVARAAALGLSPRQVIIIASVIQRETAAPGDGPKVARVFYNRLAAGLGLGSEFTVAYSGNDPTSPYNTYTNKGYPPGPYDSPGQVAISAALHPAAGDWRFFVTLPKEGTQFALTESQFFALQQKCKDEGGCKG
ncbi:MAG: endolytic transglycosylase MltG, partial [Mycobacteriales bacterium]